MTTLDVKVAMAQFRKRQAENKGKKIDNSSLPAGAPIYIYCKFCDALNETLPENYLRKPKTVCDPCKVLRDHGLV